MPRIRTIKPSFFQSEDVSALPLRARLTWIGLWTHCDDHGRTEDNARLIKARIWPLDDVNLRDIEDDLITLAAHGRIVRYDVDGRRYLEIVNWSEHQSINRPSKSRIPPPGAGANADSSQAHPPLSEPSSDTHSGKGKEGKGMEGARASANNTGPSPPQVQPPQKCPKHEHHPSPPPCGDCADARKTHDAWERARAEAATPVPARFTAPPGHLDPERAARGGNYARSLLRRGGDADG